MSYDASNIRILKDAEVIDLLLFRRIEQLSAEYRWVSPVFIRRLIETATAVGEPLDRVTAKYLDGDRTAPISPEFVAAYADMVRGERR